ncbi:MAG: DUF1553 domain-containing protein [Pirellulaceae bacterium]|jgi:mono/diheme cytochrome c family protein|nr:DUF1553 domain-containing protein [Pirellulaceae bacterium]
MLYKVVINLYNGRAVRQLLGAFGTCLAIGALAGGVALGQEKEPAKTPPDHVRRTKEGMRLFRGEVRRTLSAHCLKCHGGKSVKGDFNLATREALMGSGFVEETAKDSHLLTLLRGEEEPKMPFKSTPLSAQQIAAIARWIDLGAPYDRPLVGSSIDGQSAPITAEDRDFWSFRRLTAVTPPPLKQDEWVRTPVDQFILHKLQAAGIGPNPQVDARRLIRRAFFDLIGLPPNPREMENWLARLARDDGGVDEQAYAKLLDDLLARPQYGERWARHWLDVARFAESHGYEQDYDRKNAYHYRDFVIKALNQDLPFDRFLRWQLAGDELAPGDGLAMTATGFLGAGVFPTQLTENEFESARYDELDDMVGTTGVAFLGLSLGCARCHDHKYDPISMRDYYRLAATFTTTIRSEIDVDLDPAETARRTVEHKRRLTQLEAQLTEYKEQHLDNALAKWLATYSPAKSTSVWRRLSFERIATARGTKFTPQPDGSYLATGDVPAQDVYTMETESAGDGWRAIRVEALTHPSLPKGGPGLAANGNFALGDIRVEAKRPGGDDWTAVKFSKSRATHQQNTGSLAVAASIDGDRISGWAVDAGGIGKDQAAVFEAAEPFGGLGDRLRITLVFQHPNTRHAMGRIRLSLSPDANAPTEVGDSGPSAAVLKALADAKATRDRKSDAWRVARQWYTSKDAQASQLIAKIAQHKSAGPALRAVKAQVTSEGVPKMKHNADGRGFPHFYPQTFFLIRGDVHQKKGEAQSGFLRVLTSSDHEEAHWRVAKPKDWTKTAMRRAALANWMTDVDDGAGHLAARVIVNRLWQHHFGRGVVSTPNDFGFQGDRPTHPELLDWLAGYLVDEGWKLKSVHKLIMMSSVYRQNGDFDERRAKVDRDNRLWWRRPPRRLEGEAIRDAMLAVSGKLDLTMYGPGTLDANMSRRSIYFFIKRSQLIPMMMLFDWPEHLVSIGRRANTTTAPQALMFMNSPQGRRFAEQFAQQLPAGDLNEAVVIAHQRALARDPRPREREFALAFLGSQTKGYLVDDAGKKRAEDQARRLALADYCQIVFGMNEFIYVD